MFNSYYSIIKINTQKDCKTNFQTETNIFTTNTHIFKLKRQFEKFFVKNKILLRFS